MTVAALLILNGYIATAANANSSGYDFYRLVLQWPKSFCRKPGITCQNENLLPDEFTIHGLWPGKVDGTEPGFYSNQSFDVSKIAS
ncbi:ribonuclease T2 family protein, partial [Mycobacterium tuberculosis]|uniref:ribonuclease T2 family protein n=1 Tax=Mycobacterium tuberculosis TaxID=1773 RepID=UPI00254CB873